MGTSQIPPIAECLMLRALISTEPWAVQITFQGKLRFIICRFPGSICRLGIPMYVHVQCTHLYTYVHTYMNMYEPSLGVMSLTQKGCNPRTAGLLKCLNVHVSILTKVMHLRLNPLPQQIRLDLLCEIWIVARGQKYLAKHFQDVSLYHWM